MIGFYNYTVVLTYMGFLFGVMGIINSIEGNKIIAITCLLISGFCDMFDGKIARTKKRNKQEKSFGIQIDSLSDIVCFGLLPAIIGYTLGIRNTYFIPVVFFFPLAALIRLAYFNVTEEERVSKTNSDREKYLGLPVSSSALIFPIVCCFEKILNNIFPYIYALTLLITGMLFISKFEVKKPQLKQFILFIIIGIIIFIMLVK